MHAYLETVASPAGPLTFAVNDAGALLWVRFADGDYRVNDVEARAHEGFVLCEDHTRTARAAEQFREYHAGVRRVFDLPVVLNGTPWQVAVWRLLQQIPFGETRTYGQLAAMVGKPAAARAVGRANATNRLPLVIPCHRVVGGNGVLTGFAGGIHLKASLLAHEARTAAGPQTGGRAIIPR
ncbi:MAG: methylated-DNA--[protein]-cysteine S-methyltransferase [Thermomicrobiales bacterium]